MGKNRLILEFSEFNFLRLNSDSAQMAVNVPDRQLSIDAFDKHQDAIRSGVSRINSILHTLSNSSSFKSLKSKLSLENQKVQSLKIIRIYSNNDDVNWDCYIKFVIDGEEYFGQIKKINSKNPELTSEVFKDFDLIQTKEWAVRLKGMIIKTIKDWLEPEKGIYKLLKNEIICYSIDLGKMITITKGKKVEVIKTFENKIIINFEGQILSLVNNNFMYFNYWFEKI